MATVSTTWSTFKTNLSGKGLTARMQYDDDGTVYTVFAFDTPIAYSCTIWKGTVPPSITSIYSQAQNDTDKTDFETSFKAGANASLSKTQIKTYVVEVALAGALNKDMISIFNPASSGKITKLREAWSIVPISSGATVIVPFEVRHATAITTGATVASKALDTTDAAASSVVRQAPTGITDAAAPLWWTYLEQTNTAQGSTDAMVQQLHDGLVISELKPITLHEGDGCYLRQIAGNTSTFRMGFLFTEETP